MLHGLFDLVIVELKDKAFMLQFDLKFPLKTLPRPLFFLLTVDLNCVATYNVLSLLLHCNVSAAVGTSEQQVSDFDLGSLSSMTEAH